MDPQVRYCTTADGLSIGYWSIGGGETVGDVITEERDVHGGAVNIAARICSASTANELLVSETVRGLARTSAGVTFEDRGMQDLKGVTDPLRVYAVKSAST